MKRPGLLGIAGLMALLAFDDSPSPPKPPPRHSLWLVGDSIGVGLAAALRRTGATREFADTATTAANGMTARQAWARLSAMTLPVADIVVISLGTNDGVDAALAKEFSTNATNIITKLRSLGSRVIWLLPPSTASRIPTQSDFERLTQLDATFLQARVDMSNTWHPTAAGYDQLAAVVLEQVRKLG